MEKNIHLGLSENMLKELNKQAELLLSDENDQPYQSDALKESIRELFHKIQAGLIQLDRQNNELKVSINELKKQKTKFAGLFDFSPVGYFVIDDQGVIEEINRAGLDLLLAESKEVLIHRRFQNFLSSDEKEHFHEFLGKMSATQCRQQCRLTIQTKGYIFDVQVEGVIVADELKEGNKYNLAVINITQFLNIQHQLRKTKERLETALSVSMTGIWEVFPLNGEIRLDANSCSINGFAPGTFDGKFESFFKNIHPHDHQKVKECLNAALIQNKELHIDYRIIQPDKRIKYVAARGLAVLREGGSGSFIGTLSDVTDKKILEKEANELRINQQKKITAAVIKTEERERKRISESIHNGINQLLYGIRLQLQQHDKAEPVETLIANINKLLDQIIRETRNISFELAPSILNDFGLAVTIEEMARRLSNNTLSIQTHISGLEQRLTLESEIGIFRMVQELINNSIKHANPKQISVIIRGSDNRLLIKVSDDGSGFTRAGNEHLIKGYGLANIKNRLSLYGGSFHIRSKPGKGTIVTIKTAMET